MPTDQGPDQFKESRRIPGIDVELLGYPGNGVKKWIKCRRVKANLVAVTLNRCQAKSSRGSTSGSCLWLPYGAAP